MTRRSGANETGGKLVNMNMVHYYNRNVRVHAVNSSASLQNTKQRIKDIDHQIMVTKTVISMNLPHFEGDSPSCSKLFLPRLPIQLNWRESGLVINSFSIPLTVSEILGTRNVLRYLACNMTSYICILNQNNSHRCGKKVSANQRLFNYIILYSNRRFSGNIVIGNLFITLSQ